ncbi:hypothetical protein GF342_04045 [Candidatus Woesearchaeota archaeon]|nr:hypothetical protein [Candidatus Woesearchaeota archaeon]
MKKKTAKKSNKKIKEKCDYKMNCNGSGGAFYGLGFIGALIYYISTATGFWMGVLGVLKACVWPVFLVYGLLKFLGL